MSRTSHVFALICFVTFGSRVVHSDSLTDAIDTRSLAMGEARRAEAIGAAATILNPSGLALNKELAFEGSYGFNPDEDVSFIRASGCDSTVPVAGCFFYNYFSAETDVGGNAFARRTHEFGITSARAITPQILFGINAKYVDLNLSPDDDVSGYTSDMGLTVQASEGLQVAAVGYNILNNIDHPLYPKGFGTGISVRPGQKKLALNADALWNTDTEGKKGRYSAGAGYFFSSAKQNGYPIRIGGIIDRPSDSKYLTGGLGISTVKIGFDVAIRSQVSGGDELIVQAGIRLFGLGVN